MKDLPGVFKAFVMPYTAVWSVTTICFMAASGQEVPMFIWGIFLGSLSEMGIHWSVTNLRKK